MNKKKISGCRQSAAGQMRMVYPSESWMSVFCTAIYEEILADCWRNRYCETVAHYKSRQKGGNGIRVGMVLVWKKQGEH